MHADGASDRGRIDELLAAAGRQQTQWRWNDAYELLRHALRMARVAGVRDTELTMLNCRRMLAETLRELGEVEQARDLALPLLADCRTYAGPAHPVTVRTAAVAGAVMHDLGELDAAEQLYHSLVDTRQPTDAAAARAVMLARVNLALLHRDRGNLSGALGLLCAVHAEFRRQYGNEDLDTIRISVELADLYRQCGDVGNARRMLTVAHASARGAFGADHRLTAVVQAELEAIEPAFPSPPEQLPGEAPRVEPLHVRHTGPDLRSPRTRFTGPARSVPPNGTGPPARPARSDGAEPPARPVRSDGAGPPTIPEPLIKPVPPAKPVPKAAPLFTPPPRTGRTPPTRPDVPTSPAPPTSPGPARTAPPTSPAAPFSPAPSTWAQPPTSTPPMSAPRTPARVATAPRHNGIYVPPERASTVEADGPRHRPPAASTALIPRPRVHPPVSRRHAVEPPRSRPRRLRVAALAGIGAIVAGGTAAVVFGLSSGDGDGKPVAGVVGATLAPGAAGGGEQGAPTGVRLEDNGTTIQVSWTDESGGEAPSVVAYGPAGQQPRVDAAIAPGTTEYQLHGLDPRQDYCVVVAAYYEPEQLASSRPVCTSR